MFAQLDAEYSAKGTQEYSTDNYKIAAAIDQYEKFVAGNRLKSSENIHEFWEINKNQFGNELYEIACVIFSIPPTQAAVERCFSALKFMFSELRYQLAEDLLECCLLIHLNPKLYYYIRDLDIEKTL